MDEELPRSSIQRSPMIWILLKSSDLQSGFSHPLAPMTFSKQILRFRFDENVEDLQVVIMGEGMICDEIESSQFLAKQGIMDHFRNREDL